MSCSTANKNDKIRGRVTINVLIVDDHALFRAGLQLLLSDLSDSIKFEFASGVGNLSDQSLADTDLILLDLETSDSVGLISLTSVRKRKPAGTIVVISGHDNPDLIRDCIDNGAAGFIPKASQPAVLIAALQLIVAGGIYLPPNCYYDQQSPQTQPADAQVIQRLTGRQHTALMLAARGDPNKTIATKMGIAEGTVKLHLSAAYKTLGVRNRTEAVFALSKMDIPELRTDTDTG